jgi:hypothetical protein
MQRAARQRRLAKTFGDEVVDRVVDRNSPVKERW